MPALLVYSDAIYKGLEFLRPHLERRTLSEVRKVVIGVVEGDTHDDGCSETAPEALGLVNALLADDASSAE